MKSFAHPEVEIVAAWYKQYLLLYWLAQTAHTIAYSGVEIKL